MAANYRTTMKALIVLAFAFSLTASAEDKPKRNAFQAFGHWVNHHKKVVVITAGSALASGLAYNAVQGSKRPPVINMGPVTPCPSSACVTVPK